MFLHGDKYEPHCLNPVFISNSVIHQQRMERLDATLDTLLDSAQIDE